MLEDLIMMAVNDASSKIGEISKDKMKNVTGGLNLAILVIYLPIMMIEKLNKAFSKLTWSWFKNRTEIYLSSPGKRSPRRIGAC